MKRVWFDIEIGTNPDCALALLFALKHPELKVVGVSISGTEKSQQARLEEARAVLQEAGQLEIPVYLGKEITSEIINEAKIDNTIVNGPLTNIARLILDEAQLGQLNIRAGAFSKVNYRGTQITVEENAGKDKDATRIVLSQYENIVISSLDATNTLVLDPKTQTQIEQKTSFIKSRFEGYQDYLKEKNDETNIRMILHALLPVCDVLNTVGISRELIEFKIQADGSFLPSYQLANISEPVPLYKEKKSVKKGENQNDKSPEPTVKQQAIRTASTYKIFQELLTVINQFSSND
jgi:inosine-uridine nucleoside N-ribohydrolase